MIKLVCFDLDGVLVDSTEWHFRSFNDALRCYSGGWEISPELHEKEFNGLPTLKKLAKLVEMKEIHECQVEPIAELKSDYFQRIVDEEMKPDPLKIDVMRRLHGQGLKVAVVSNCNKINIQLLLHKLGLLDEVDFWVSAEDVVNPKPAPDGYLKAMEQFGVQPNETLIFEDSPVGLASAFASGAQVIPVREVEEIIRGFVMANVQLANRGLV